MIDVDASISCVLEESTKGIRVRRRANNSSHTHHKGDAAEQCIQPHSGLDVVIRNWENESVDGFIHRYMMVV